MADVPFSDTNIFLRYLTNDLPDQAQRSRLLIQRVLDGELTVRTSESVIVEAVQVLSSPHTYRLSRGEVAHMLTTLLLLNGIQVAGKDALLRALELWATSSTAIDFVDTLIVAQMEQSGSTTLYSFDRGFNRFPQIIRREP